MRSGHFFAAAMLFVSSNAAAQISSAPEWSVYPLVGIVKQFPGEEIDRKPYGDPIMTFAPTYGGSYQYAGTGLQIRARLKRSGWKNTFLTVSGSMTSYSRTDQMYVTDPMRTAAQDVQVGYELYGGDFTNYAVASGVQFYFPESDSKSFLLFAGAEATMNFINGTIDMSKQMHLGYHLSAGFDVRPFEFAITYTSFSDIRNIGATFGFRFSPFTLD